MFVRTWRRAFIHFFFVSELPSCSEQVASSGLTASQLNLHRTSKSLAHSTCPHSCTRNPKSGPPWSLRPSSKLIRSWYPLTANWSAYNGVVKVRRCRRRCCGQDLPPHILHYEQVPFRIRSDSLRQLCGHCYVSIPYYLSSRAAVYIKQEADRSRSGCIFPNIQKFLSCDPTQKSSSDNVAPPVLEWEIASVAQSLLDYLRASLETTLTAERMDRLRSENGPRFVPRSFLPPPPWLLICTAPRCLTSSAGSLCYVSADCCRPALPILHVM